jgi:prepilin signal peptidase PulO-like enzyme (type II secretory pathway)
LIAFWISLPLPWRFAILAVSGLLLAALANHVIYRGCYFPRPISPWGPVHDGAPPRRKTDRIPLIGWIGLRREASIHGSWFWLRPLSIELLLPFLVPAFYWFETQSGLLFPEAVRNPANIAKVEPTATMIFGSHLVLLWLMVVATFIDFDEQTIPDLITIPGTLFGLLLSSLSVYFFIPVADGNTLVPATFFVPGVLSAWWMEPKGLAAAWGIWSGWCFALADRRLILRRGLAKAVQYFFAGLVRYPTWKMLVAIWLAGLALVSIAFSIGGLTWVGLLTGLVGMAVGGGVVWAIRIVAGGAMGVEALGFGDVTLMAMVGAFLGWQAAVMGFFLAPFAAIFIVLVYLVITRESRVPFGPYLCAGSLLTILMWDSVMNDWFLPNFAVLGPFVLWLFIALTGIMGVMLFVWRIIKESYFRE